MDLLTAVLVLLRRNWRHIRSTPSTQNSLETERSQSCRPPPTLASSKWLNELIRFKFVVILPLTWVLERRNSVCDCRLFALVLQIVLTWLSHRDTADLVKITNILILSYLLVYVEDIEVLSINKEIRFSENKIVFRRCQYWHYQQCR